MKPPTNNITRNNKPINNELNMNRINLLFQNNPGNLLSIYFCAGSPSLEGTAEVIRTLEQKGVQMVEIGIPFSDPMADGPVIQQAATKALHNGMTLKKLFSQLADIRSQLQKTETKAQERIQTDMDMLRFISRIDHNVNQIDKRSEARQETLLREVRDSFKLLVRTISGQDK